MAVTIAASSPSIVEGFRWPLFMDYCLGKDYVLKPLQEERSSNYLPIYLGKVLVAKYFSTGWNVAVAAVVVFVSCQYRMM